MYIDICVSKEVSGIAQPAMVMVNPDIKCPGGVFVTVVDYTTAHSASLEN